ncbi:MAG: GatB/YqeY domain-containing protein [Bacilli bacterium]|nr:GatB/YqeY domain-containing protein [Bacilli bacterium]
MNLYEKFNQDMVSSMKEQNKERLTVLRMIKGAMQLEHINNKKEMNEELLIDVVGKQIKMRNDSLEEFKKGNREDLIKQTEDEIKILTEFLPEQLSEEEVDKIIDEVFAKVNPTSPKEMGLVMKEVTPLLKGKADMKEVSTKIKNILG